ncbi:hypothetical protein [Blastomonas sp. AAP53]|uniref:hypothetical protein n=1 Tax=Blastomonas sp. AAP53 TaxID=1248760 RepID=UPI00126765F8|nr:hypothetical protein [Blastomonas sp. AAP53]
MMRRVAMSAKGSLADEAKPVGVLIDSCIRRHAVTHEEAWIDTGTVLWGGVHPINTGYMARVPVHAASNTSEDYRDICYIGSLIALARFGTMKFFTSSELMSEQLRHPPARFQTVGYSDYSILDMVEIDSVDGERYDFITMGKLFGESHGLKDAQQERIETSGDELYKVIMSYFKYQKHSQDAWHLRTAQVHGCRYILTMDQKFIHLCQQHHSKLVTAGISVEVCSPTHLGEKLKLPKIPPWIFSYNDASFPVRSDLHMPDQKRKPSIGRRGTTINDIPPR